MSEKTYIELCKNDIPTVQINVWRDNGEPLTPSGAYYAIKGSKKDNIIVPRSPASIDGNKVYTQVGLTVTASAAEYDLYWELQKDGGDVANHCTKVLVIDTC
jgi:hypothetical protein